jgi:hypothetical protein
MALLNLHLQGISRHEASPFRGVPGAALKIVLLFLQGINSKTGLARAALASVRSIQSGLV